MDARQFFNLVSEMRNKQKEYFKTRTQSALKESKALEKRVDDEIARVAHVCNGKLKQCKGYIWKWANDEPVELKEE